ncbi:MAG: hypothetical protein MRY78_09075 [Saprospiraceae bacterium]|nr:hypothetical protein [Saprospiraceae bacterium]
MELVAIILVNALMLYLSIGFFFAIPFVIGGVQKIDKGAAGSSWFFRVLIFPGVMAFWPFLLKKWIKARKHD